MYEEFGTMIQMLMYMGPMFIFQKLNLENIFNVKFHVLEIYNILFHFGVDQILFTYEINPCNNWIVKIKDVYSRVKHPGHDWDVSD